MVQPHGAAGSSSGAKSAQGSSSRASTAKRQRLPPDLRAIAADKVYSLLSAEDQALALDGVPEKIDFAQYRKRVPGNSPKLRSPLQLTHEYLQESHSKRGYGKRCRHSAVQVIKTWFIRMYKLNSVSDLATRPEIGEKFTDDDWDFLRACLIEYRYDDPWGNRRRFDSLQFALEHWQEQHSTNRDSIAGQRAARLLHLKSISKARGWDRLARAVREMHDLSLVKEDWKANRSVGRAMWAARRLAGKAPMLEYYRSTQAEQGRAHRCKRVTCLPLQLDSVVQEGGSEFGTPYVWTLDPGLYQQITGSLDGFRIDNCVPVRALKKTVYR